MHIVADENIPLADAFFSHLGRVERLPGRSLTRHHLQRADLLLVRSVTAVDAELLADTPVRFVASATIGTDPVDLALLAQRGIGFSNAPGSLLAAQLSGYGFTLDLQALDLQAQHGE